MPLPESQLESWIRQACLIEVRSAKPGNVSPRDSFEDANACDFEQSARTIAPILANTHSTEFGASVLAAITATRKAVGHNTNLGIVLLLTPLVRVPSEISLSDGIAPVLDALTVADAEAVYQAIRVAAPGGLGDASDQDTSETPTVTLRQCMSLAADRDLIAAQYANGFEDVLGTGLNLLRTAGEWKTRPDCRLAWIAVSLMAAFGDSLIQRKCGLEVDATVRRQAAEVLHGGWPFESRGEDLYGSFDQFLRADGNRRNPGTTADMIAAIAFAALRDGLCVTDADESQLVFSEPNR